MLRYDQHDKKQTTMERLNVNWITQGLIDFEYKQYLLLAYLEKVKKDFMQQLLYPSLSELVGHYTNLKMIKENKVMAMNSFPKRITKLDFKNFKIEYEDIAKQESEVMKEIDDIVNFAIPKVKKHLDDGKEIYELVEDKINISPIGIVPLYSDEGYMFVHPIDTKKVEVFEFQITIFEEAEEKFKGIKTNYITTFTKDVSNTYEKLKIELVSNIKKLPNPATYLVESALNLPLNETLLPIAKRSLVRYISTAT